MMQTEYIRSMHCNYERILLDKQPEEKKYQYCILNRGGIKGLLPCTLRYLNGLAYLYYDISSRQSVAQLYGRKCVDRVWLKDFVWSLGQLRTELERFLLDERNVLWFPEQVFQDIESNVFSFLYIPYYEGENGFGKMLEYLVEHIDYEDEGLVECVYKMYEQYEKCGEVYLQERIYEDIKVLNEEPAKREKKEVPVVTEEQPLLQEEKSSKGIRYLFEGRKRRRKGERENYEHHMKSVMEGYAVAEESAYCEEPEDTEDYGRTIYIEETEEAKKIPGRLFASDGRILKQLNEDVCIVGKKKEGVDLVIEDFSVSRMHARICKEDKKIWIEDLNSTNGTFVNGIRLQPYEKKNLQEGDEIKIGKVGMVYR